MKEVLIIARDACIMSLTLLIYSLVTVFGCSAFLFAENFAPFISEHYKSPDLRKNETMVEYDSQMTDAQFILSASIWNTGFHHYLFLWFVVLFKLNGLQICVMLTFFIMTYIMHIMLRRTVDFHSLFPVFGVCVSMFFAFPSKRYPGILGMLLMLTLLLGYIFILLFRNLRFESDHSRILFLAFGFPVAREAFNLCVRFLARMFYRYTLESEGRGSRVNIAPVIWFQILGAAYSRLFFTQLRSNIELSLAIAGSSILEMLFRTTMRYRDKKSRVFLRTVLSKVNTCRSASAAIVPEENGFPHGGEESQKSGFIGIDGYNDEEFAIQVIFGEKISEFAAIIIVAILTLGFGEARLFFPLDYYLNLTNPFTDAIPIARVLSLMFFQLLAELVVDTLCNLLEAYQGYNIPYIWTRRSRLFLLNLFSSGVFSGAVLFSVIVYQDELHFCPGLDICCCKYTRSLRQGGFRDRYCEYIYAETFGLPPQGVCQLS